MEKKPHQKKKVLQKSKNRHWGVRQLKKKHKPRQWNKLALQA